MDTAATASGFEPIEAERSRHAEVIAEIGKLQQEKTSWTAAIMVLGRIVSPCSSGPGWAEANGPGKCSRSLIGILLVH